MKKATVQKIQKAILAIQAAEEALVEEDAGDTVLACVADAIEGMENVACVLGFGVVNGVIVKGPGQ